MLRAIAATVTVAAAVGAAAAPIFDPARYPQIVDASAVVPELQVDLKYATADNFMGRDVYGDFRTCYLTTDAAQKLARAAQLLRLSHPELRLHVFDCLRPRSVQLQMWEVVKGTPQQRYVANPHGQTGSLHNYGCAVDLSLGRLDGAAIDMGTPFDHFGAEAHITEEAALLASGTLTHVQLSNRLLLRQVMVDAGFYPLNHEWWHFNCATREATRAQYTLVE